MAVEQLGPQIATVNELVSCWVLLDGAVGSLCARNSFDSLASWLRPGRDGAAQGLTAGQPDAGEGAAGGQRQRQRLQLGVSAASPRCRITLFCPGRAALAGSHRTRRHLLGWHYPAHHGCQVWRRRMR